MRVRRLSSLNVLRTTLCIAIVSIFLSATCGILHAVTLNDLFAGKATFRVDEGQTFGKEFHMHFLSAWRLSDNDIRVYFIAPYQNKMSIGIALSHDDGKSFVDTGKRLEVPSDCSWDSKMRSFPSVWKDGGKWFMVFEGTGSCNGVEISPGDIGLAESKDGINWSFYPKPILVHEKTGWEKNNIGTPMLYKEGGIWYLFYHGYGSRPGNPIDGCQVGVAYGPDLLNLKKDPDNPIIATGTNGFDAGTIGKRSILREGNWYYMVYEVSTDRGKQGYRSSQWSSGIARAKSLLGPWEKYPRPVLPQTSIGMGNDGPEFIKTSDGAVHIYYRTPGNFTKRATLVQESRH